MTSKPACITMLFLALGLTACAPDTDSLKLGGKDFGESRILSEMMALLAEADDIPVTRRIGLGPTMLNLESLKRGDIDLYVEYNGTGLVMLGQPAMSDGDAAMQTVSELYAPLDLEWGNRLGFANNYGLAMQSTRAREMDIETLSDLEGKAGDLVIGMDENFQGRPLDGYQPLTTRYGFGFGDQTVVSPANRLSLYDLLLDGSVDVAMVFTTDGQIDDLGLSVLQDDRNFFPVYEAAPLYRADAVERFPRLEALLEQLGNQLDEPLMRRLNSQVDQAGLAPRAVARAALAELGLIDAEAPLDASGPLVLATSTLGPDLTDSGGALRAVRNAFPDRRVLFETIDDPLMQVANGDARLALTSAVELVGLDDAGEPALRPFEAVGVAGQSYVHLIRTAGSGTSLGDVTRLVTGPEGSASHRTATLLAAGMPALTVAAVADDGDLMAASDGEGTEAVLLLAPLGSATVTERVGDSVLLSTDGWNAGNNLVRFPWLREARIPAGTYTGQDQAIESLSSQLVLAGPVVVDTDVVGPQGPGASMPSDLSELTDDSIEAIHGAMDSEIDFDPALRVADVLAPRLPAAAASMNPSPTVSGLSLAIFALVGWMIWLYGRPQRNERHEKPVDAH